MKHYHAPIVSAWLALLCVSAHAQTISGGRLPTRWAKDVSLSKSLPEYPRPQMVRGDWRNLNGSWEFAAAQQGEAAPIGKTLSGKILVPFPAEAALSGVGRHEDHVWYRRTFTVPSKWSEKRVLLHFGAVNWEAAVYVNGKPFPAHKGGYDEWTLDITDALTVSGPQEIVVGVDNLVDANPGQAIGKQRLKPGGILYTAATGIWQTVWLEPVSTAHIGNLDLTPDVDSGSLRVTVTPEAPDNVRIKVTQVKITALDRGKVVGEATGDASSEISVPIPSPHLWSPSDPHLYDLRVSLMSDGTILDSVKSYFAMRKISLGKDDKGVLRPLLNGKFVFQVGTLDQGYWPDGVYTAPTDAALKYDIEITKKLGFNMIRKHAKVEPDRWYYWTDKLGMLVWQDMPQAFSRHTDASKQQFEAEMRRLVLTHDNHPSIVAWTIFNEGWGQHETEHYVSLVKELDPTRLINGVSGWTDVPGVSDMHDIHNYPAPSSPKPEETRIAVNGEFGGLGMRIEGHMWEAESWGYQGLFTSSLQLNRRYQKYLKQIYGYIDNPGLSAVVYTQLTDVESESNGLLTYDRHVIKPDVKIIAAANQGKFPALPADPNPPIVANADEAETPPIWSYTTDTPAADWNTLTFDASSWKTGPAGFGHDSNSVRTEWTTDDIWIRREIDLPANLPAKLAVSIIHDDDAQVYINGVLAADAPDYAGQYTDIAMTDAGRAALKPGKNVIAVHCHNRVGGQFIDLGIVKAGAVANVQR